ncbi:MAG: rhomboid family intramembrane serine protease [Pseudomonadota bacterium]
MFFPFRDHNPSRRTPYVTWALIATNVLVFLGTWPLFSDPGALMGFFGDWAMIPSEVTGQGEYHTMLTSMFLHGGFGHLAGNMLFLYIYGDNIEDELGPFWFLLFYLTSGFAAAFAHLATNFGSNVPTVGASGAIAGVMGAYLLMYPKARVDVLLFLVIFIRVFTVPAWLLLGFWMVSQMFSGFTTPTGGGGVAYWAHIGGFVAGIVLIFPIWSAKGGPNFWRRTAFHPDHEPTFSSRTTSIPVIRRR